MLGREGDDMRLISTVGPGIKLRSLKVDTPPPGWAEMVGDVDRDELGNVTSVWIPTPPYHRPRTQADIDAAQTAKIAEVRELAKAHIAEERADAALTRAAIVELLNYSRHIANQHNDLLAWLGGQTTLTSRGQLNGFAALTPTNNEARQAIKDRIDNGEADS